MSFYTFDKFIPRRMTRLFRRKSDARISFPYFVLVFHDCRSIVSIVYGFSKFSS
jgi:hypothetical protein